MGKSMKEIAAEIKSLKACAHLLASNLDNAEKAAQYAIDHIAGFPAECSDEARKELNSGFLLRFNENNPAVEYGVVDGNYIRLSDLSERPLETVVVGIDFAMSFTTHEFGRMAESHSPQMKALVKDWRDRGSDYCSTRFATLVGTAKRLINKGKSRPRSKTSDFSAWLVEDKGWLDTGETRCRNANKRGDVSADLVKFKLAKDAFLKVWSK